MKDRSQGWGDPVWFTQPLLPPLEERRDLPALRLPAPTRVGAPRAPVSLFRGTPPRPVRPPRRGA